MFSLAIRQRFHSLIIVFFHYAAAILKSSHATEGNMTLRSAASSCTSSVGYARAPVLQLLLLPLQLGCFPLQLLLLFDQVGLASSCRGLSQGSE